jgi:hypothetical protein
LFCRVEFVIAKEEFRGLKISRLFKMRESDLRTHNEWGPVFYGRLMAKFGYSREEATREAREILSDEQPGCVLKVEPAKGDFPPNISVDHRLDEDNEAIAETREYIESVDPLAG